MSDAPAELAPGFGEMHFIPASRGRQCRLESCRARADNQHGTFGLLRRDDFWVPAAPPLLAHRRVLRAAQVGRGIVARHTHITADAFADLVDPPFLDLLRQERIGDRGPRRADEVHDASPNLRDHRVRRGEAPHADHRLARQLFDEACIFLLKTLLCEARRLAVVGPVRNVDVPQVRQLGEHLDHVARLAVVRESGIADQLVAAKAHRDRALVADCFFRIFDQLAQQAHPVLEASAIFISSVVLAALKELLRDR